MTFAAVAIGRNEGARLRLCLKAISEETALPIVYVDSGSTDDSVEWAREQGKYEVVELDLRSPFTAARARNAGARRLGEIVPDLRYVQFVDGDCEVVKGWARHACHFLETHSDVGAVAGRLRERYPDRSIYNWLCDQEWDGPVGEVGACGGIVMMRMTALAAVGGFRDELIAGEEPELCVRLRAAGWLIWRLDTDMAHHDAAMMRFSQWWQRAIRTGYAFAQNAHLHGAGPERFRVWECRRAWLWGVYLPLVCLFASVSLWPWGLAAWLTYPLQMLRQITRNPGSARHRALLAFFQIVGRFPEAVGQLKFLRNRIFRRQPHLIEYK